jgi:hypothetical protein
MNRYLVEMRMSGSIEGVNCQARSESEAIRIAEARWPNATFYRIKLLG